MAAEHGPDSTHAGAARGAEAVVSGAEDAGPGSALGSGLGPCGSPKPPTGCDSDPQRAGTCTCARVCARCSGLRLTEAEIEAEFQITEL